jgi:hypothetical protein
MNVRTFDYIECRITFSAPWMSNGTSNLIVLHTSFSNHNRTCECKI